MTKSSNFETKFTHFLEQLSNTTGWQLENGCIQRKQSNLCECPLTAIANFTSNQEFNLAEYNWAGTHLGFTEEESDAIAIAADGEIVHYKHYNIEAIRQMLLRATMPYLFSSTITV